MLEPLLDSWADLAHGSSCLGCGRPGRLLCPGCAAGLPQRSVAAAPSPCPPGLAPCRVAGEYDAPLRQLLLAHKERRAWSLTGPLGGVLAEVLAGGPWGTDLVLVPVPSRRATVRSRGHDPLLRMVRVAAARLRVGGHRTRVLPLLRSRLPVRDQAGLTAVARARNLADSMAPAAGAHRLLTAAGGRPRVVLCDDVLTTGATAREAQRALEDTGIDVAGIACVAATRRRRTGPLPLSGNGH